MHHAEALACHDQAWACLRAANRDRHRGRRAMLISAAYIWEALARDIDEAAERKVGHMESALDEDDRWLLIEIARMLAAKRAAPLNRDRVSAARSMRRALRGV
jgi:hypothetical protein